MFRIKKEFQGRQQNNTTCFIPKQALLVLTVDFWNFFCKYLVSIEETLDFEYDFIHKAILIWIFCRRNEQWIYFGYCPVYYFIT